MASTTLTSKGKVLIPKTIRDHLKLKSGDRFEVATDGDRIVMTPLQFDVSDVCAILPQPKRVASLTEIDAAIRTRASRRRR